MSSPVYAHTRRRDPTTGELAFDGNRWSASPSPQAEVVLFVLRTQRGMCLVDPDLGVDWRRIDKLAAGAASTARDAIVASLRFLTSAGAVENLTVQAEVDASRGLLKYDVAFTDPRLARRARIRGEV